MTELEQAAEPADVADDLGTKRGADVLLDELDGLLARRDVDARLFVREAAALLATAATRCGSDGYARSGSSVTTASSGDGIVGFSSASLESVRGTATG